MCRDGRGGPWQEPACTAHGFLAFTGFSRKLESNTDLEIPTEATIPTPFEQEQKTIVQDAIILSPIAVAIVLLWGLIAVETLAGAQVPLLIILSSILGAATVGGNLINLAVRQMNLEAS